MLDKLPRTAFFVSISSDIASHIAFNLLAAGTKIEGTYRTESETTHKLRCEGAVLHHLDCDSKESIERLFRDGQVGKDWDLLMISPATMKPINKFHLCDWDEWESSFRLNSLRQFQILHCMIERRSRSGESCLPLVYLWSGPGTNNAPVNYSAEISAKIAQIKMCELLDKEHDDIRFVIVGPGWVNTKAHRETIEAGGSAGSNYTRTLEKLKSDNMTTLQRIYEFFCWVWAQDKKIISGRNFSIRGDIWGQKSLEDRLLASDDSLKLRRFDNDWSPDRTGISFSPKN